MAKKPTLNDLTSLTNETSVINTINNNNDAIETAFENTISRDGSTPNTMEADFDMNGNKILNVGDPTSDTDVTTKKYVDERTAATDVDLINAAVASTSADRTAVESLYDQFDDRYLGAKASDPTLDNDGNPLQTGAVYFNTTSNVTKYYNGTTWQIGDGFTPPASSTDNALPRYDGTTGVFLQNSGVIVDDSNNMSGIGNLTVSGTGTFTGSLTASNLSGTNTGDEVQATTSTAGIIELATQAEVDAGTDTTRAVTPATLAGASIGGKVLGQKTVTIDTLFSTLNTIPADDTIPQITEGAELLSLSYTPVSATTKLYVWYRLLLHNNNSRIITVASFRDGVTDAVHSVGQYNANNIFTLFNKFTINSGSTSTTTFSIRVGGSASGTTSVNGTNTSRVYGGTSISYLGILEVEV